MSAGIMTRLWTGRQRNRWGPAGTRDLSLLQSVQTGSGDHLSSVQWVPGMSSLGVKQKGREADYSLPTSVKIQNEWSCTSIPPYAFMACTRRILHLPYITIIYQFFSPWSLYLWRNRPCYLLGRKSECVVPPLVMNSLLSNLYLITATS